MSAMGRKQNCSDPQIDAADEGADEGVECVRAFEVGQVAGAFDRSIVRRG